MSDVQDLEELTLLATRDFRGSESTARALEIVRARIGADQAVLVYGADDGFRHVPVEVEFDLTPVALWLIQRNLVERGAPCAFGRVGARVTEFHPSVPRLPCTHTASLIPTPGGYTSEMLICTGNWPRGLSQSSNTFLRRVDQGRRQRHVRTEVAKEDRGRPTPSR